ncbi:MAG TPA: MFS transporter [Rubrivivax sp.]|nr:MFS transporter [Rubrivivax sp.]
MPAAAEPDALPRGAVACLSASAFGSGMSLRVNDALLPKLAQEFAVPLGTAAQVISLFAIAYGVAQLFFGPLGDRFGKYRVVAWAAAACGVAALACALAPGFDALRAGRVLSGVAAAAIIPLSMAWIGDVVPYARRQPVLARFLIGQIAGLSAGVWLGGFAADHLSWRAPYVLIALLFAGASAALFALQRRLPPAARATTRAAGPAWKRVLSEFGGVLSQRWARALLLLVFVEGMCLYGPFAFIATHLNQRFGLSLASAGSLVMLFGLGGLVFALGSGRLLSRLGEGGLARGGGVLMCAALLAIGLAPAWGWVPAGCFVLGLGFYMLHNTLQVNATQMAPQRRGAAVSAFAACFFLGQSAGVSLGGWWVGALGAGRFMVAGAAGLLAVAFAFVALCRRLRPAAH